MSTTVDQNNKQLAAATKQALKDLGHDISLGHIYEMYSKLSGFNSWNVAKAKNVQLAAVISPEQTADSIIETMDGLELGYRPEGLPEEMKVYEARVHLGDEIVLQKKYRIVASSAAEAEEIIKEYLSFMEGELDKEDCRHEQTKILIEKDEDSFYSESNWDILEIDSFNAEFRINEIFEQPFITKSQREKKYTEAMSKVKNILNELKS